MSSRPVFEPADVSLRVDPYPALKRLREDNPVHFVPALKGWAVFRYADVQSVLRAPDMSADKITPFYRSLSVEGRSQVQVLVETLGRWLVFRDPPDHTRLRSLVTKAFTARRVGDMRARIKALVDEQLDRVQAKGEMDVIRDLAHRLPVIVICDMLGIPEEHRAPFLMGSNVKIGRAHV